jgi:hypothetical protein
MLKHDAGRVLHSEAAAMCSRFSAPLARPASCFSIFKNEGSALDQVAPCEPSGTHFRRKTRIS